MCVLLAMILRFASIFCAFSSFKVGSGAYCYFFKGIGSSSGEFFFLDGSDCAGFCVFCGGFSPSGSFW